MWAIVSTDRSDSLTLAVQVLVKDAVAEKFAGKNVLLNFFHWHISLVDFIDRSWCSLHLSKLRSNSGAKMDDASDTTTIAANTSAEIISSPTLLHW